MSINYSLWRCRIHNLWETIFEPSILDVNKSNQGMVWMLKAIYIMSFHTRNMIFNSFLHNRKLSSQNNALFLGSQQTFWSDTINDKGRGKNLWHYVNFLWSHKSCIWKWIYFIFSWSPYPVTTHFVHNFVARMQNK